MTLQELVDALDERKAFRWLIGYTAAAWETCGRFPSVSSPRSPVWRARD